MKAFGDTAADRQRVTDLLAGYREELDLEYCEKNSKHFRDDPPSSDGLDLPDAVLTKALDVILFFSKKK